MTETVSWLSQELCTLLNSVVGFAQLMQRDAKDVLSPRQRMRADEIVKAGEQVVGLLGNVLDLCHAERGRVSLQIGPTDPRMVLEAVCTSLAPLAARGGSALRVATGESADVPLVMVDARWLHQILMTLGRRAIEQPCRPSSVVMELSSEGDGVVRVKVSDSGPGIPPDAQATLFLPLRHTRGSDTIEATGLPLAIANRLAELMRCQLRFRSTWTHGSEFWMDLPAYQGSR
jgi:signal transduction histidine kinase